MEKNAQIGELMAQREKQKADLAHLRLRQEKIVKAYRTFASNSERWVLDPTATVANDGVALLRPESHERELPAYLYSQSQLAQHVREMKAAEQSLAVTLATLRSLGISDVA